MDPTPTPSSPTKSRTQRRLVVGLTATAVAAVVALLVVGLMNQGTSKAIQDALAKGERPEAPAFTLPLLAAGDDLGPAGREVSLDELGGTILVVNFWAQWCGPCAAEAPILEDVARRYRARGDDVIVLGVNVQDLSSDARAFIERHGLSFPSLRDNDDRTKNAFEVARLPETFVVDKEGMIALKLIGQLSSPEELTTAIDQLLDERARVAADAPRPGTYGAGAPS